MRKIIFALLILIGLSFQACSNQQASFNPEKKTIISGKIINYDNSKDPEIIKLIRRDFFQHNETFPAKLDSDGTFKVKLAIAYTQEFQLEYGGKIQLFCLPGDSLYLEIDRKLSYLKSTVNKYTKFMDNEFGNANMEYNKFLQEKSHLNKTDNDAIKNMQPANYKNYIKKREKSNLKLLEKFCSKNSPNQFFKKWAMDNILYESMDDLFRYCWLHPRYNKMRRDSFLVSEEYYSFLKNYDMNDNEVFSWNHSNFLNEIMKYTINNPKDSAKQLLDKNQIERSLTFKNMIKMHSRGLTRKILYAKYYSLILDTKDVNSFESIYDSTLISDPYLLNYIKAYYTETKENMSYEKIKEPELSTEEINNYLSNKENTGEVKFSTIKSVVAPEIIDSIASKHKGKVILIDFWAPWCSPCVKELPFTQTIQEYFKDENIDFVFVAYKCPTKDWKNAIANKKLKGEHILLTEDQFFILSSSLGFAGTPHYTLLDKNGKIALKTATRPENKEKLISEIEELLN